VTVRVAVLASGGGSNLQSLIDYSRASGRWAVDLVISDREGAGALARAAQEGIPHAVVDPRSGLSGGSATGEADPSHAPSPLASLLATHEISIVLLAGYLRLVPADVVQEFRHRILNIHPSLLPAFGGAGMYGGRVHEAVLEAGSTVTGVTVHEVDEVYDRGRILAQWPVPVLPDDSPAKLSARVLQVEHCLYPRVVDAVVRGSADWDDAARTFALRYDGESFGSRPFDRARTEGAMDAALAALSRRGDG